MTIIEYAQKFIGAPYIWGGDGSACHYGGFDCSGFVLECLWAFGKYKGKDTTADGLLKYCKKNGKRYKTYDNELNLLFFGKNGKATHVAIAIGASLMIEAGGGDSKCSTQATSKGFLRIRPIDSRKDFLESWVL